MFHLRCITCKTEYSAESLQMVCGECNAEENKPLRGILEVVLDDFHVGKDWTVLDFLPVKHEYLPPVPVGNTPVWEPQRLRELHGLPRLFIKDDGLNPSGSLKDRASFLVSAQAKMLGINDIVVASTGNAGSSMACIGAASGQNVRLYLPQTAPEAKMVQSLQYGAELIRIKGSYDRAYEASLEYSLNNKNCLSRNTAYNPFTIEGKKTVSLEIVRTLGRIDAIFVSVGDGVIISGIYKGFEDLVRAGIIEKVPLVYGVQAEGSNAISRALKTGDFQEPEASTTLADSIAVEIPRGGYFAIDRLKRYEGEIVEVSDDEIVSAQKTLSDKSGLFAEPAAAAAYAGFRKTSEKFTPSDTVVILSTGNGLKDIAGARRGLCL